MTTPLPDRIDAAALDAMIRTGTDVCVIDVRTPSEFESAHIPGAYNVPLDLLGGHAVELAAHVTAPVVLVCRSGARAARASSMLAARGMGDLRILDGGIQAWNDGRRAVRRGRQRWDLERQVRLVAGSLVLAGIVGSRFVPRLKYLSGFVGAGLTIAALTDTCAMGMALAKLPYNRFTPCAFPLAGGSDG